MLDGIGTPLEIVVFDGNHQWEQLPISAVGFLDEPALDRLKRLLGNKVKCVFIEHYYIDKDYRDTFSNYHSKRFNTPSSRCVRLHFFDAPVDRALLETPAELEKQYIGYSVIRPTRPNAIGRSLFNPAKLPYTKGTVCVCEETVFIQGSELNIRGFPFISQDADVTVCAQSALWMLLRYYSNRLNTSKEIYPHQISSLTNDYSIGRLYPSSGLTLWQMGEACRRMGHPALIYDKKKFKKESPDIPFEHLMYTYVESGLPIVVSLPGHAIIAFGHHSNYAKPAPPLPVASGVPQFAYSSYYNDALVVNDDNTVPYELLSDGTALDPGNSGYPISEIDSFMVALPEKVFLSAEAFQVVIKTMLNRSDFGYKTVSPRLRNEQLMLRLFLTTGKSFKKGTLIRPMGHSLVTDVYRNLPLPHFIWVCEISTPSHYARHEILGEIVWDATRNVHEMDGWLTVHYPERIIYDYGTCLNMAQDMLAYDLSDSVAYPLYRSNLEEIP